MKSPVYVMASVAQRLSCCISSLFYPSPLSSVPLPFSSILSLPQRERPISCFSTVHLPLCYLGFGVERPRKVRFNFVSTFMTFTNPAGKTSEAAKHQILYDVFVTIVNKIV